HEWAAAPVFAPLGWRYDLPQKALVLTPGLMALLGLEREVGVRTLLRRLDRGDRAAAIAALRRMSHGRPATAFAHDAEGIGRIVQH
ncbi:hypothetical protein ABTE33_20785, partial [Acinetobacter baumannii]